MTPHKLGERVAAPGHKVKQGDEGFLHCPCIDIQALMP